MTKRVLIFPFNLLAHYLRCLVLADRLQQDGYEIFFAYSEAYHHFVERHGYAAFLVKQFDAGKVVKQVARFDFSWLNDFDIEDVMLSQIAAIERLHPDLVIGDAEPTLKMASTCCGVKYRTLMNGYLSPYYANSRKISKRHPAYGKLRWMPASVADNIVRFAEKMAFKQIHKPFKRIRARYKLKALNGYMDELEGDEVCICDDVLLFPQKKLPLHYTIIGPLIYHSLQDDAVWLNKLNLMKPTICVCMGSSGNWEQLRFLNHPYYAQYHIISTGDFTGVLTAAHIIRKEFINLTQVLRFSQLLICHGGNGTINCGWAAKVFMFCLPTHVEQEWNIQALERLGAGRSAEGFGQNEWQAEIEHQIKRRWDNIPRMKKSF